MTLSHLYSTDLNLLRALDALLEERSVTRAGLRVGLTQPAMSRALSRLRELFGDALLVPAGRVLRPTPRAEALRQPLREAMLGLAATLAAPGFDPSTSRRAFNLATADYGAAVVVPPLLNRLAGQAPGVDLILHPQDDQWDEALAAGALDAAIFPMRRSSPGIVWTSLFAETFICLARRDHPSVRGTLSLEEFCRLPHLFVSPSGSPKGIVDQALARRGLTRRIALRTQGFLVAPQLVGESDLIAVVPTRIAALHAPKLDLQVLAVPLPLPGFSVALAWHERVRADPSHTWFRRELAAAARTGRSLNP